jgi:hypothetical protein
VTTKVVIAIVTRMRPSANQAGNPARAANTRGHCHRANGQPTVTRTVTDDALPLIVSLTRNAARLGPGDHPDFKSQRRLKCDVTGTGLGAAPAAAGPADRPFLLLNCMILCDNVHCATVCALFYCYDTSVHIIKCIKE